MLKISRSESCAIFGAALMLAHMHRFTDSSQANLWLESVKLSNAPVTTVVPPPYHQPVIMDVMYFVDHRRDQKVKVQIEIQQVLQNSPSTPLSEHRIEIWTPLFGTLWVKESDDWRSVADYQYNWVTERLFLHKQYRPYPYLKS